MMKRIVWQVLIAVLLAFRLPAQPSLEFFTNQANALLETAFGFGVGNIPVYCSTNPAVGYSASLHYQLQSAANAYDATTPVTNFPSVFRPLFGWSSNTLFIIGYTNVTTDFYTQTARGFKEPSDPSICTNDNVWGIPWVVGAKNNPPAFNNYSYATVMLADRKLLFERAGTESDPITNWPPIYTNQLFAMSISNAFAVEVWNYSRSNLSEGVTIVASNQVTMVLTNNYNWGTNITFSAGTNETVNSWRGWTGGTADSSFLVPLFTNVIPLPSGYWSESTAQFVPFTEETSGFLPSDLRQLGWPVHNWVLTITNNLTCAVIDNPSGQVLDFVNLGAFGSSIPITQTLTNQMTGSVSLWNTNGATESPYSPMSIGLAEQLLMSEAEDPTLVASLDGEQGNIYTQYIFGSGYDASGVINQKCTWQSSNPLVHYTVSDLTSAHNETTELEPLLFLLTGLPGEISANLARLNMTYNSGTIYNLTLGLPSGMPQLNFQGVLDLPYAIWASPDMLNWSQIGIALQLDSSPASFQFNDPSATNYPARFYEVRLP
jgi:hypothetical protein